MVFDKPANLLVIPSPDKKKNTLVTIVNDQYAGEQWRLHPCHRLDKETTGAILFAKGKKHQKLLMDEFKGNRVRKKYIALIQGRPKQKQGNIQGKIRSFEKKKYFKPHQAKEALTRYRMKEERKGYSVLEIEPVTGRSNQIRIQLKQIGHPLLGERKYAFGKDFDLKFRRVALHAATLQWKDPVTKETISVEAPLPEDMERFLKKHP